MFKNVRSHNSTPPYAFMAYTWTTFNEYMCSREQTLLCRFYHLFLNTFFLPSWKLLVFVIFCFPIFFWIQISLRNCLSTIFFAFVNSFVCFIVFSLRLVLYFSLFLLFCFTFHDVSSSYDFRYFLSLYLWILSGSAVKSRGLSAHFISNDVAKLTQIFLY